MLAKSRGLALFSLAVMSFILAIIPGSNLMAVGNSPSQRIKSNQIPNQLDLDISITPKAASPGDRLTLTIQLTNNDINQFYPEILIDLPNSLSPDMGEMPAGTFFNVQESRLSWQPVLPGPGSIANLSLVLTVNVADMRFPEQVITARINNGIEEKTYSTSFWLGVTPSASISIDPPQAAVGQPVKLLGEVAGPGPISQLWSLGDGRIVEAFDPEVIFAAPGTYQILLQASNPLGITTTTAYITILAQPIAKFKLSDSAPSVDEIITFVNQSGGEVPITYHWDFGDGSSSQEISPQHQYPAPGIYQAHLIIENVHGSSEAFLAVTVGEKPVADFIMDEPVDAGRLTEGRAFFDESVTQILWDMGDGRTYEGETVNHIYWAAGDYLVTLVAGNDFGDTTLQRWIHVNPGQLFLYLPLIVSGGETYQQPQDNQNTITNLEESAEETTEVASLLPMLELPTEMSPQEQLLSYINEARKIADLQSVIYQEELGIAAQAHSDDMARLGFTGHVGSDGSSPALRVQLAGYPGGYAGEATAWGMQRPHEPVQFWLSSPAHRDIILDPQATNVGIGFSQNINSPNIWYWTAEFGSMELPPVRVELPAPPETQTPSLPPIIQLLGPPQNSEFTLADETNLIFTWSWPEPLQTSQRFGVYLNAQGRIYRIGGVSTPQADTQYQFKVMATTVPVALGQQSWQVRLEDSALNTIVSESTFWPIIFQVNPASDARFVAPPQPSSTSEPTATPTNP